MTDLTHYIGHPRVAMHKTNDLANHRKAPVRRETAIERAYRKRTQVPTFGMWRMLKGGIDTVFTINKDLVPSKAKFVREPIAR